MARMTAARTVDVLIVSLGATGGLRAVDDELLASLHRAGADAAIVRPDPPSPVRTLMLTDLRWARASRRALQAELAHTSARALIYSTTTSALLWPRPGAIRFDAPAAGNRRGRHGLWQRPLERRRLREAPLLLPQSAEALREIGKDAPRKAGLPADPPRALVLPVAVEPSGPHGARDVAAVTYAANPHKKGLDRILDAWRAARGPDEQLLVAGVSEDELGKLGYALPAEGVRVVGMLSPEDYRALLRRARVFVCAARREDYGIAQLEALADGCLLVTTPSPGPYVALPIARGLDGRLVSEDLAAALRTALDDPAPDYAERALHALAPLRRPEVDRLVAEELLPRLLDSA
jgi:glycosyltransferase involved in cell wall biosynthesis